MTRCHNSSLERKTMINMDDAVSQFITGTCQLIPKVSLTTLHNLVLEIALMDSKSPLKLFCIIGSSAEFSIQPVHQDILDIDILLYSDEQVLVEEVSSSLSSRLAEYRDSITCYELEPYADLPGYGRIRLTGILAYDWECSRYNFHKQEFSQILSNAIEGGEERKESGIKLSRGQIPRDIASDLMSEFSEKTPAGQIARNEWYAMPDLSGNAGNVRKTYEIGLDANPMCNSLLMLVQNRLPMHVVHSIRCPIWPKEALSWKSRPRASGWPSVELIEEVVRTGCDVEPGRHPLCEEPELVWRLSFARAEVVLVRRWSSVQQIVYHMLRYFARRNLIFGDSRHEVGVLSTYHLKTLMLWTCETEPPDWWNSSSLLVICSRLLSVFYKWLKKNNCPHYFIPNCNLFSSLLSSSSRHHLLRILKSFKDTSQLSRWFLQNYVLDIHRKLCKSSADVEMDPRALEQTMVLACRLVQNRMLKELEYWIVMVSSAYRLTLSNFDRVGGLHRSFNCGKSEHRNIDCFSEFAQYVTALNLLQAVGFVTYESGLRNDYKIFEIVAGIFTTKSARSAHGYPPFYIDFLPIGEVYYVKALELMSCLPGKKTSAEFNLLAKLSLECLKASLNLQASDLEPNYCSSLCYLVSLHNGIGSKDVAAGLVSLLDLRLSGARTSYPRLHGYLLLYNDEVSNILGFFRIVKHIAKGKLTCDKRITTMSTFSIEVFAKYLGIICGVINTQELNRGTKLNSLADYGLFSIMKYKLRGKSRDPTVVTDNRKTLCYSRLDTRRFGLHECYTLTEIELVELMTECALNRLDCFFESVSRTFDVRCNTALCYRALYLYSRRKYDEVSALCEKLIGDEFSPLLELQSPCFAVSTMPPFDKFYDRDIRALLGFAYLFDMCCEKREKGNNTVHLPVFGYSRYKTKLVVLETNKKTFITGRFIANYLKLRCLLDKNRSVKEIVEVYRELKSRLPFEHIVRQFALRNLVCRYISSPSKAFQHSNQQLFTEMKHNPNVLDEHAKLLVYKKSTVM